MTTNTASITLVNRSAIMEQKTKTTKTTSINNSHHQKYRQKYMNTNTIIVSDEDRTCVVHAAAVCVTRIRHHCDTDDTLRYPRLVLLASICPT